MLQSDVLRDAEIADIVDEFNAQVGASGVLEFWTGAIPAFTTDPDTTTLLASLALSNPAVVPGSGTAQSFNPITSATAIASGTIGYARIKDGSNVCVVQLTVAVISGGDVLFNTLSVTAGDTIAISSANWQTNITP